MAKTYCEYCDGQIIKWMNHCTHCGEVIYWEAPDDFDECAECETAVHPSFNYCYACGLDFEQYISTKNRVKGFKLKYECDNEECDGKVDYLMGFCPWCGYEKDWEFEIPITLEYRNIASGRCSSWLGVKGCGSNVDPFWYYCAFCGEKIKQAKAKWGRSAGKYPRRKGIHTCFQCSAQWQMRIRVKSIDEPLPPCLNCGIHGSWMYGK